MESIIINRIKHSGSKLRHTGLSWRWRAPCPYVWYNRSRTMRKLCHWPSNECILSQCPLPCKSHPWLGIHDCRNWSTLLCDPSHGIAIVGYRMIAQNGIPLRCHSQTPSQIGLQNILLLCHSGSCRLCRWYQSIYSCRHSGLFGTWSYIVPICAFGTSPLWMVRTVIDCSVTSFF